MDKVYHVLAGEGHVPARGREPADARRRPAGRAGRRAARRAEHRRRPADRARHARARLRLAAPRTAMSSIRRHVSRSAEGARQVAPATTGSTAARASRSSDSIRTITAASDLKDLSDVLLAAERQGAGRSAGAALRPGSLVGAAGVPGAGRRRQGRHDQARDGGPQPAGLRGARLQGAVDRGARPRLPVAHDRQAAAPRPHRHLQPLVLRGDAGRARPPGDPRPPAAARRAGHQEDLERALRGRRRLRALSRPAGRRHPQVLPASSPRTSSAGGSSPGSTNRRRTGSSRSATSTSASTSTTTSALTRTPSSTPRPRVRRGTSCPRTASGSRAWWSPRR